MGERQTQNRRQSTSLFPTGAEYIKERNDTISSLEEFTLHREKQADIHLATDAQSSIVGQRKST